MTNSVCLHDMGGPGGEEEILEEWPGKPPEFTAAANSLTCGSPQGQWIPNGIEETALSRSERSEAELM